MTKKIIAIRCIEKGYCVSQEFEETREENTLGNHNHTHCTDRVLWNWDDVILAFDGVHSVRAFERALERVETLCGYKHRPVVFREVLPPAVQVWIVIQGQLCELDRMRRSRKEISND